MRACVLTVSDGVFHGAREDGSGDVLAEKAAMSGFDVAGRVTVPDEADQIAAQVSAWADAAEAPELVLVTGGTGFAPRDVTPEALGPIYDRKTPGIDEAMRADGECFGLARATEFLRAHRDRPAGEIVERLCQAARDFTQPEPQADDLTVVVLKAR